MLKPKHANPMSNFAQRLTEVVNDDELDLISKSTCTNLRVNKKDRFDIAWKHSFLARVVTVVVPCPDPRAGARRVDPG